MQNDNMNHILQTGNWYVTPESSKRLLLWSHNWSLISLCTRKVAKSQQNVQPNYISKRTPKDLKLAQKVPILENGAFLVLLSLRVGNKVTMVHTHFWLGVSAIRLFIIAWYGHNTFHSTHNPNLCYISSIFWWYIRKKL